ncbi:hypothetical protein Lpar_2609 [Legionella parisiensis]|uniref:Uncharacterized protein n=1 Tax=Legionella parisiensis TaxID=45071 RepID=A0A1E5JVX7_9GAMM|nr:hypothetical protein Lpar_2609 [Legionella parisiensis]OEH48661.1 hypothetical protein lpari_00270 [Legionella parisiensis]STX76407.1 Uncharacterised protein [Legionella parisiensis]
MPIKIIIYYLKQGKPDICDRFLNFKTGGGVFITSIEHFSLILIGYLLGIREILRIYFAKLIRWII